MLRFLALLSAEDYISTIIISGAFLLLQMKKEGNKR